MLNATNMMSQRPAPPKIRKGRYLSYEQRKAQILRVIETEGARVEQIAKAVGLSEHQTEMILSRMRAERVVERVSIFRKRGA